MSCLERALKAFIIHFCSVYDIIVFSLGSMYWLKPNVSRVIDSIVFLPARLPSLVLSLVALMDGQIQEISLIQTNNYVDLVNIFDRTNVYCSPLHQTPLDKGEGGGVGCWAWPSMFATSIASLIINFHFLTPQVSRVKKSQSCLREVAD